jgi:predicted membrane GTPase involved in stress response
MGSVMENLAGRKAEITSMNHHGDDVSIEALIPTRGLIGFETDLVNMTRGLGVISHLFHEYGADRGEIAARKERLAREHGKRRSDGLRPEHDSGTRAPHGGAR